MNEAFRVKKILQSLWCSSASKNFQKLNGKQAFLLNCRLSHSVHLPVDLYIFTDGSAASQYHAISGVEAREVHSHGSRRQHRGQSCEAVNSSYLIGRQCAPSQLLFMLRAVTK
jgi:hypothetical protein